MAAVWLAQAARARPRAPFLVRARCQSVFWRLETEALCRSPPPAWLLPFPASLRAVRQLGEPYCRRRFAQLAYSAARAALAPPSPSRREGPLTSLVLSLGRAELGSLAVSRRPSLAPPIYEEPSSVGEERPSRLLGSVSCSVGVSWASLGPAPPSPSAGSELSIRRRAQGQAAAAGGERQLRHSPAAAIRGKIGRPAPPSSGCDRPSPRYPHPTLRLLRLLLPPRAAPQRGINAG